MDENKKVDFSAGTKQAVYISQNGFCAVDGCYEKITDIHHRLQNTKGNQKLFPLFLQSPFNGAGLCRKAHQGPKKEQFRITEKQARMYEEYLQKIKEVYNFKLLENPEHIIDMHNTFVTGIIYEMKKWISFRYLGLSKSKKTQIWSVVANDKDTILGEIKWFGRWRQYAFFPSNETVWNIQCLKDICEFIKTLKAQHKGGK